MDAPIYPPAAAFVQPIAMPQAISLENYSLADLIKMPAAWAIVVKHLPLLERIADSPMLQPHLGNFTVPSMNAFTKSVTPEILAAIDQELSRLPRDQDSIP